jgi:hypothetical protein
MMVLPECTWMHSKMWVKARSTKVNGKIQTAPSYAIYSLISSQTSNHTLYCRNKQNNKRDGLGVQLWPDGSKYEGMWRDGKCSGMGRMTHANGDIY